MQHSKSSHAAARPSGRQGRTQGAPDAPGPALQRPRVLSAAAAKQTSSAGVARPAWHDRRRGAAPAAQRALWGAGARRGAGGRRALAQHVLVRAQAQAGQPRVEREQLGDRAARARRAGQQRRPGRAQRRRARRAQRSAAWRRSGACACAPTLCSVPGAPCHAHPLDDMRGRRGGLHAGAPSACAQEAHPPCARAARRARWPPAVAPAPRPGTPPAPARQPAAR